MFLLIYDTSYLYIMHDIIIHLLCHAVHIVVTVVVHDGVSEHEHDVSLELHCTADTTTLNVLLDCLKVHWSEIKV